MNEDQNINTDTIQVPEQTLTKETEQNVMGATIIENKSSATLWTYVGVGIVIVAIVSAGIYFWVTRVTPGAEQSTVAATSTEESVTGVTSEEQGIDTAVADIDAATDFSSIENDLNEILSDLESAQ